MFTPQAAPSTVVDTANLYPSTRDSHFRIDPFEKALEAAISERTGKSRNTLYRELLREKAKELGLSAFVYGEEWVVVGGASEALNLIAPVQAFEISNRDSNKVEAVEVEKLVHVEEPVQAFEILNRDSNKVEAVEVEEAVVSPVEAPILPHAPVTRVKRAMRVLKALLPLAAFTRLEKAAKQLWYGEAPTGNRVYDARFRNGKADREAIVDWAETHLARALRMTPQERLEYG